MKPIDGLTVGFSGFYKFAENYLDKGQFGAPVLLTAFNYAYAQVKGFEVSGNYDKGPVVGSTATSPGREVCATNINSAQFNFEQARSRLHRQLLDLRRPRPELDGIGRCRLRLQPRQRVGNARLGRHAVRQRLAHQRRDPQRHVLLGLCRRSIFPSRRRCRPAGSKGTQIRLDAINLTDGVPISCATGTGVGVGAPQYGMRRAFFVTLSQKF